MFVVIVEWIKIFYGGVVVISFDDCEEIEIGGDMGDWYYDCWMVSCVELIGIMCFCVEEIFEEVCVCLDVVGFEYLLS